MRDAWTASSMVATLAMICACGRVGFGSVDGGPASSSDAVLDAPACGARSQLRDDFEDGAVSWLWSAYADAGIMLAETNGTLVMQLAPNAIAYTGYESACRYDLRDGEVRVEVVTVPTPVTSVEAGFGFAMNADNNVGITASNGMTIASRRVGGVYNQLRAVAYNATQHRHWRILEVGGVTFWETSVDRLGWVTLHSEPTPIDASLVGAGVLAGSFNPQPNPGMAVFDNFEVP